MSPLDGLGAIDTTPGRVVWSKGWFLRAFVWVMKELREVSGDK